MMRRTPEPESMNSPEQALAYAQEDFSEPHNVNAAYRYFSTSEHLYLNSWLPTTAIPPTF